MKTESIHYECNGVNLKGHLAYLSDVLAKRPAVIIAHAWRGQDDFARQKAEELAELGYVGFAIDLYGEAKSVETNEEALELMLPLFLDRQLLRERMQSAVDAVKKHPMVDPNAIGAIGFCFGGLAVIELLFRGAEIAGIVSFHGVMADSLGEHQAITQSIAKGIDGSMLLLHGFDDPLTSKEDVLKTQEKLTAAGINWEMNVYGNTMHAFTNPEVNDPANGLAFNEQSNRRAWRAMCNFFDEIFI